MPVTYVDYIDNIDAVLGTVYKKAVKLRYEKNRKENDDRFQKCTTTDATIKVEAEDEDDIQILNPPASNDITDEIGGHSSNTISAIQPSTDLFQANDDNITNDLVNESYKNRLVPEHKVRHCEKCCKLRNKDKNNNVNKKIRPSPIARRVMAKEKELANQEKLKREEAFTMREAKVKTFPEKSKDYKIIRFNNEVMHNRNNPYIAAVIDGNLEAFKKLIGNCSAARSNGAMCFCSRLFNDDYDNPIMLAQSLYYHQLECDDIENCGRRSCKNEADYFSIIKYIIVASKKDQHLMQLAEEWMYPHMFLGLYANGSPLSYSLYQGNIEYFNELYYLMERENPSLLRKALGKDYIHDVIQELLFQGVDMEQNPYNISIDRFEGWHQSKRYMYNDNGKAATIAYNCLSSTYKTKFHKLTIFWYALDFENCADFLIDIFSAPNVFYEACTRGALKIMRKVVNHPQWNKKLVLEADKQLWSPMVGGVLSRQKGICTDIMDLLVEKQYEYAVFPRNSPFSDLFIQICTARWWKLAQYWLALLRQRMNQDQLKREDCINHLCDTLRKFILTSSTLEKCEVEVILKVLLSTGAYLMTDPSDMGFLEELKRKGFDSLINFTPEELNYLDIDIEMSKLSLKKEECPPKRRRID